MVVEEIWNKGVGKVGGGGLGGWAEASSASGTCGSRGVVYTAKSIYNANNSNQLMTSRMGFKSLDSYKHSQ